MQALSLIAPQTKAALPVFYLFWLLFYVTINVIWDTQSKRTPPFHISKLTAKTAVGFNAVSFASSLLILVGVVDEKVMKVAGDTLVPIILAGFSGVLFGLAELCPYKLSVHDHS